MDINRISAPGTLPLTVQAVPQEAIIKPTYQVSPPAIPANGQRVDPSAATKQVIVNQDDLKRSVDTINKYLKSYNNSIQFSIDKDSGQVVVKLVDTETQAILKQTPTKEALAMAQALEKAQGLFIHTKA